MDDKLKLKDAVNILNRVSKFEMKSDVLPKKIIFTLNDDGCTYTMECHTSVSDGTETKDAIIRSEKTSYPKHTDLFTFGSDGEKCLFTLITDS